MWNNKETSQLTTAHSEWLVPMWYHTKLKSQLCDVNFLKVKTMYCNFVSLKVSSAKVDEILREKEISYNNDNNNNNNEFISAYPFYMKLVLRPKIIYTKKKYYTMRYCEIIS